VGMPLAYMSSYAQGRQAINGTTEVSCMFQSGCGDTHLHPEKDMAALYTTGICTGIYMQHGLQPLQARQGSRGKLCQRAL
jgi:hypothetical protein